MNEFYCKKDGLELIDKGIAAAIINAVTKDTDSTNDPGGIEELHISAELPLNSIDTTSN